MSFDANGTLYVLDSGNSTIIQLYGHTAQAAGTYHFTNPSLFSTSASISFFGQAFPNAYVILNGRIIAGKPVHENDYRLGREQSGPRGL